MSWRKNLESIKNAVFKTKTTLSLNFGCLEKKYGFNLRALQSNHRVLLTSMDAMDKNVPSTKENSNQGRTSTSLDAVGRKELQQRTLQPLWMLWMEWNLNQGRTSTSLDSVDGIGVQSKQNLNLSGCYEWNGTQIKAELQQRTLQPLWMLWMKWNSNQGRTSTYLDAVDGMGLCGKKGTPTKNTSTSLDAVDGLGLQSRQNFNLSGCCGWNGTL
ncbi:Hypothetical protein SRAE_0000076300, partial [Strongyloides ratti]